MCYGSALAIFCLVHFLCDLTKKLRDKKCVLLDFAGAMIVVVIVADFDVLQHAQSVIG